jgi:DNA-directed RNA polymerase subunit RPC12/RpoP
MDEHKDKPRISIFRSLALKRPDEADRDKPPVELTPAMPELGTAPCPVCGHKVAVFVTRTKRPFINCGFCSARIFYNGSRSMQLLQKQIKGSTTTIVQPGKRGPAQTEESRTQSGVIGLSTRLRRSKP